MRDTWTFTSKRRKNLKGKDERAKILTKKVKIYSETTMDRTYKNLNIISEKPCLIIHEKILKSYKLTVERS